MIWLLDKYLLITFYLSLPTRLPVTKERSTRRGHYETRSHGWTEQTVTRLWDISEHATRGLFGFVHGVALADPLTQIYEDVTVTRLPFLVHKTWTSDI